MKVGIIGTGNVGSALTAGLTAAGHDVVVGSRDPPRTGVCQFAVRSSNGVRTERASIWTDWPSAIPTRRNTLGRAGNSVSSS